MFGRFLVPLDGSQLAEKAAQSAAELARHCKAELVFVRACSGQDALKEAADYLDPICQEARAEGLLARAEVRVGEPSVKICQVAEEEEIDLIVMSSHGRTGLARTVFGSVAETVMRAACCPVMVVKVQRPPGEREKLELSTA